MAGVTVEDLAGLAYLWKCSRRPHLRVIMITITVIHDHSNVHYNPLGVDGLLSRMTVMVNWLLFHVKIL